MDKQLPVMEDCLRFRYVGDPRTDGSRVAWTASFWDTEAPEGFRRFREQIRLARLEHDRLTDVQTVTAGGNTECLPGFGPDGSFYFLSDAPRPAPMPEVGTIPTRLENELFRQLQLFRMHGCEIEQLTAFRHGITRYAVSPDGEKLLLQLWRYGGESDAELLAPRTAEQIAQELAFRLAEPFTTEEQSFKLDAEMGYRSCRTQELWLLQDGNVRKLLSGGFTAPGWMPDSCRVLYQQPGADGRLTLRTLDIRTGAETLLASIRNADPCFDDSPAVTDEVSGRILFAANTPDMEYADPRGLFSIPIAGGEGLEAVRLLSSEADVDGLFPQDYNFLTRGTDSAEWVLSPDGNVYYTTGLDGDVRVARVRADAENAAPALCTGPLQNYHDLSALPDGRLLCLCALPDKLPELALLDPARGGSILLTDSNPWMEQVALQTPQALHAPSGTQGFYLPPVTRAEKAPVIVYAHGGPTGFYCSALNYEYQAMAAAGFGVVYANPRGGTGFGKARSADHFAYDGAALADTEEFLDAVCADHPELDGSRAGICGGSYGGFLTLSAAVHSRRFRAACAHRALANLYLISTASHSAGGHTREQYPRYTDFMRSCLTDSVSALADNIRIPLLMLSSELDANCIPEQANQIFTAMRSRNPETPCRYILYPDSCHGLNYKGPMELSVHHRNANLDWFRQYLQKEEIP